MASTIREEFFGANFPWGVANDVYIRQSRE